VKLTKKLTVSGKDYLLNTDDVRLDLFNPGKAAFDVVADAPLSGFAIFSAGYDPQNLQQVFYGYVENSFAIDAKQQRIFCRELSGVLSRLVPLNLRNVTLKEVLAAIAQETGIEFVAPDEPYSNKKAPAFYSMSSGYSCMDNLAHVFSIAQLIWQQQGDGKTYVGSWQNSYWKGRGIDLPVEVQASSGLANTAKISALPKLRPGVFLNNGNFITKVHWVGEQQNIAWDKNPWGTRWTNRSSV